METINERLDFIIRLKAGSRSRFAEILKVSPQYVNKISTPGGSVGLEPVLSVLRLYPDINARWLLLGDGDPFLLDEKTAAIRRNIGSRIDLLLSVEKYLPVMDPEEISGLEDLVKYGSYTAVDLERIPVWEQRLSERSQAVNEIVRKAMDAGICKTRSDKQ